jgi:hypothetical protein
MHLSTAYALGAVLFPAATLVSSFAPLGPVTVTPPKAFVARHPYRHAVDNNNNYPLRTPLGLSSSERGGDALLTPETYADSESAENEVENIIMDAASDAFKSTDFTSEPHLPPELESCEVVYDTDLVLNDDPVPTKKSSSELFQRSLLAQQIAYNTKDIMSSKSDEKQKQAVVASKNQETFQRSLLAARISNDLAEKSLLQAEEDFIEKNSQINWMESEVRAASLGGKEILPFHDVAEMATTRADIADADDNDAATNVKASKDDVATDKAAATDNNMVTTSQVATTTVAKPARVVEQDSALTSYVIKKGVEQTKERMRQKLGYDVTSDERSKTSEPRKKKAKGIVKEDGKKSVMLQKLLHSGLVQRLRQPKFLILSALVIILCRSLALAWLGNPAMRILK